MTVSPDLLVGVFREAWTDDLFGCHAELLLGERGDDPPVLYLCDRPPEFDGRIPMPVPNLHVTLHQLDLSDFHYGVRRMCEALDRQAVLARERHEELRRSD